MTTTIQSGTAEVSLAALAARHGLARAGERPRLRAYSRQLWRRRHFIAAFATARVAATYSGTRLGQLWQVLTPLVNAAVYYVVFGLGLGTAAGIPHFVAYLCAGVFAFTFTSQALTTGCRAITDNLDLIRTARFPRAALPLALTLGQLRQMAYATGALAVIAALTGVPPRPSWLLVPPMLVLQALFNAGLALAAARIGAAAPDTAQLMPFVTRTWMYTSGVFYSGASVLRHTPSPVGTVFRNNPVMIYIDLLRHLLIGTPDPGWAPPDLWAYATGWALLVGAGGYLLFWRGEQGYGRG